MFWRSFRDKAHGLSDLLRYVTLAEEGVLVGKGGELMGGFWYFGTDTESSTVWELNAIATRLNSILNGFSNGWMIHCDAVRYPAVGYPDAGAFPDPVSYLVDAERRSHYNSGKAHFQSAYALIVTYLAPSLVEAKSREWMFETTGRKTDSDRKTMMSKLIMEFNRTMADIEGALGSVFYGLERMGIREHRTLTDGREEVWREDQLVSYLHFCVTGHRHPVRLPDVYTYLDAVIASEDFLGGMAPKIGDKHIAIVNIDGFPAVSHPGILDYLNRLPMAYRFSTRFIFMDAEEAKSLLNRQRKKWRQKVTSLMDQLMGTQTGAVDHDALEMMQDAESAMSDASSMQVKFGFYTGVIILMDEDAEQLKKHADFVKNGIADLGFPTRIEHANAVEAYLGSLPGDGIANIRKPIIHTLNLAHFLPTTSIWPGPEVNPCPFYGEDNAPLLYAKGAGATPFRLSLHVGDVGHTLILGPTGSGKSTLLEFIKLQHLRYKHAKVFAFDKGLSAFVSTNAIGGAHFDIGGEESRLAFCPLKHVDRFAERVWAAEWIEILLNLNGVQLDPRSRTMVSQALQSLAAADPQDRSMTHFQGMLQDNYLRDGLNPYVGGGAAAHLLDAQEDNLDIAAFTVFEMEHLMNMGEKSLIPVLLYLFHRIEAQLDGSPVLIVLDEAWLMLSHPLFLDKIKEWLKVLRKANAAVIFATQSIEDVTGSAIAPVIFQSCATKLLLPNPEAKNAHSAEAYRMLGLNDAQLGLIAGGVQKRDYYYLSSVGRRLFQLELGPIALAFVGTSGKDDIAKARELIRQYGKPGWVSHWLEYCGLPEAAGVIGNGKW